MKSTVAVLLAGLTLGAAPAVSHAIEEQLRVALPERHELVEVQPGVQVIPGFDLEVFFAGGAYWLRSGGAWYTTRRPAVASTFTIAEQRSVPAALARLPDGSHLDYEPAPGQARSTKVLTTMEPPEREAVAEAAPARIEPPAAPTPAPAPARPVAARPAGAKPAATKATATAKAPAAKPATKATAKPAAARTATKAPPPGTNKVQATPAE